MSIQSLHTEKQLLALVAKGDEMAFRELFNRYWDNIYSVALVLSKSAAIAEDMVQDVFMKVWMKREELVTVEKIDSYLFIIARNHIFSELKKLKVRQDYIDQLKDYFLSRHLTPEDQLLYKESSGLVEKAICRLPSQQEQVYRLIREKGYSHERIAAELGISHHTVRNHMIRALRSIREYLQAFL